ncbi:CYIR protein, partial [Plasmodium cynomolgi strain B]
ENCKSTDIPKCCKSLNHLLYDQIINNLLSICTILSLYSNLQKLRDEKNLNLVICNEHKEDLKYESYIELNVLITPYKDFNAYKASSKPKQKKE